MAISLVSVVEIFGSRAIPRYRLAEAFRHPTIAGTFTRTVALTAVTSTVRCWRENPPPSLPLTCVKTVLDEGLSQGLDNTPVMLSVRIVGVVPT
jgi:hypothetical protein